MNRADRQLSVAEVEKFHGVQDGNFVPQLLKMGLNLHGAASVAGDDEFRVDFEEAVEFSSP